MKIYTSYFSNAKKLAKYGIEAIGIALFPPKWFTGISLKMVAPTYSIFKYSDGQEEYVKRYENEVLSKIDAKKFVEIVESYSRGKDVALCCFEMPNEFCHRHLLAKWLNSNLNIDVKEFIEPVNIVKQADAKEQELF